eukprot:TRINITY_DN8605_c0_g1_i1.p1 TRINITY_DN8605_c0_g1~~TRINITY_DN8605_c0_g1_i1.p1  ORF type:complete len:233 (+),score=34.85 TRINITY_DN8605_c0_g1_i1:50-700(+)
MAHQRQREVDQFFVEDLRNFLFGEPGQGGMDLVAINTNRGRDHGIPTLNQARVLFGLEPYTCFEEMTTNVTLQQKLRAAYGHVDDCEIYSCGLLEDHAENSNVGSTFKKIILTQYRRTRDSDRFWFENTETNGFSCEELEELRSTRLSDVIMRNTDEISRLQCDAFKARDDCHIIKDLESSTCGATSTSGIAPPSQRGQAVGMPDVQLYPLGSSLN